jgi:hypothetical protein
MAFAILQKERKRPQSMFFFTVEPCSGTTLKDLAVQFNYRLFQSFQKPTNQLLKTVHRIH